METNAREILEGLNELQARIRNLQEHEEVFWCIKSSFPCLPLKELQEYLIDCDETEQSTYTAEI